jgi:glycosyl hydrolase family 71
LSHLFGIGPVCRWLGSLSCCRRESCADLGWGANRVRQGRVLHMVVDRRHLVAAGGLLLAGASAIAVRPRPDAKQGTNWAGPKKVYAHWHWFPTTFDNLPPDSDQYANYLSPEGSKGKYREEGGYIRERPLPRRRRPQPDWAVKDMREEIEAANAIGLNGFQFNIGSIRQDSRFMINLRNMLEAAKAGPTNFEIALSLDALILGDTPVDPIVSTIIDAAKNPRISRHSDGRLLLGAFAPESWGVDRWSAILNGLASGGCKVFFVPTFLDYRKTFDYIGLIDGASMWGVDRIGEIEILERVGRMVKAAGKTWASVVWPQDFRPHNRWFSEAGNSELFRRSWQSAININSDIVNICTWNDYSEGSEIRPSTSIQYAFYDLAAYYIKWFQTSVMPEIENEVLYYFHRIESTNASGTGTNQPFRFSNRSFERTRNDIELLAFLTGPGKIEITTAAGTKSLNAPAGITSLLSPLVPGKPRFRLVRENKPVIAFESAFEIRDTSLYQDLLYHAGSSSRPAHHGYTDE